MATQVAASSELQRELTFTKQLNEITNLIHSAKSIDDILMNLSGRIRELLDCQRLTIYAVDVKNRQLYSVFKVGNEEQVIRVPADSNSIAGYTAVSKKTVNIKDAYDAKDLTRIHPKLRFDDSWDKAMGFRTQQVLSIPLTMGKYLLGVMQMINKESGDTFSAADQKAAEEIGRTLAIAFYNQNRAARASSGKRNRFSALIDKGLISEDDLESAVTFARVNKKDLGYVLIDDYKVPKGEVGAALSEFYNCPFFDYDGGRTIPEGLRDRVPLEFWRRNLCAPLERGAGALMVVVVDPLDLEKVDAIKATGLAPHLEILVGLERDILEYLSRSFDVAVGQDSDREMTQIISELDTKAEVGGEGEEEGEEVDSAVVRLVNKIISDGYNMGVSDIHIEPYGQEKPCVVRFRRDGVCFTYQEIPPQHRRAVVSRLKIMAQLDISEKRKPQDGKIAFKLPQGKTELRVATLPTAGDNEDVVMRVLAASKPIAIDELGMSETNLKAFKEVVSKPYGLVLCVGPTGSGKTTSLHSALGYVNREGVKIWTAEDPVEITQAGLRQLQVNPKIGLTFAAAMRSFLRADPDIIMVGEMRDRETAAVGIEASLTGHLVLSTLHTNSAPETITRLLDMGLDPFNFADSLLGILAQRLVRTLCSKCREPYHPDDMEVQELVEAYGAERFASSDLQFQIGPKMTLFRSKGCEECAGTGYRGRMALHELLVADDGIKRLIVERKPVEEIRRAALQVGMTTLLQDGVSKVSQGLTDLKQVKAVCIR